MEVKVNASFGRWINKDRLDLDAFSSMNESPTLDSERDSVLSSMKESPMLDRDNEVEQLGTGLTGVEHFNECFAGGTVFPTFEGT